MSTVHERERNDADLKPHPYKVQRLIKNACAFCGKPESNPAHRHLLRVLAESDLQERERGEK